MNFDLVIRGARAFQPGGAVVADVGVAADQVVEVGDGLARGSREIDARGLLLLPGLLDDHVHFREPGKEDKEDFATGTLAAAHGGATTVFEIQNNAPLMVTRAALEQKLALVRGKARVHIGLYANANAGSLGQLAELADLAVGFKVFLAPSHGDAGVDADHTLLSIFETAARLGKVIAIHAEDRLTIEKGLTRHASGGAEAWSRARPPIAEIRACERAIRIAERTGATIHIFHLSTAGAVDLIADAKERGVRVTGGTCPHYLVFSDEDVARVGGRLKCNPSIKSAADRQRLREGVRDGILEVLETDHAPHLPEEKRAAFEDNPSGISSIDVFLPALLHLLREGVLADLDALIERACRAPARIFGLPQKGRIEAGADADLVLVDDRTAWQPTEQEFCSKAKVSPWVGFRFPGRVVSTWVAGRQAWP